MKPRTFRPTSDNEAAFQFAEKHELNISELINEVLSRHFRRHMREKAKKMFRLYSRSVAGSEKRSSR